MLVELLLTLLGSIGALVIGAVAPSLSRVLRPPSLVVEEGIKSIISRSEDAGGAKRPDQMPSPKAPINEVRDLVSDYHSQALEQGQVQFWFSIVAATVGFGLILYSGFQIRADAPTTALKVIPGTVLDAVALLFFKQVSETRQRATDLFDRLRRDQQVALSREIASSIEDPIIKSDVLAKLALHLVGLAREADTNKQKSGSDG